MSEPKRWYELILPLGIIACLLVILVPLPPAILDILLAANITIAVIVLLTTIQVKTPLEFGIFPTLLLATTLSRVVLNIATTRLILSRGAVDQSAAAGGVIQSFGEFVAGNQIAVGIVIFAIIVIVQFVIITKGATRISEVAARFTLDGMPGRQMAIDADLNAGVIDATQAQQRREDLQRQADFYGAMDGASKFVRGDAIAGILITAINIAGGLAIGLAAGMSAGQAGETFTKLTIGDGLVTQIPGLLISLAAGILITRSTRSSNLPGDFVAQLFSRPQVLMIAGAFLIALIFTQLPMIPLLLVGGGCIAIAVLIPDTESSTQARDQRLANEAVDQQKEKHLKKLLTVDPIEIELGVNLIGLASGGQLLEKITRAREALAEELGIVLPKVRVRDNLQLEANQFQVRINQLAICQVILDPERTLLIKKTPAAADPGGQPATWHSGFGAWWVDDDSVAVKAREYLRMSPADAIVATLKHQSQLHAAQILTRQATAYLIDQLRETHPATVNELLPDAMRVGQVQQVLQRLLAENVSIRPLNTILEALSDSCHATSDIAALTEAVRRRLSPWITASITSRDGRARVVELDQPLQGWLERQLLSHDRFPAPGLDSQAVDRLVRSLQTHLPQPADLQEPVALLVNQRLRPVLQEIIATHFPQLVITTRGEMSREAKIETIAILRLGDVHYAAA